MDENKFKEYRKKPVVIQAYQTDKEMEIETLEGTMKANKGDYIIKGVKGELYPCKPDVFDMTYEDADTDPTTIDGWFNQWNVYIIELSDKEKELITLKESYNQMEQEIIAETDFKALYGKNNETVRKNHVKNELKDLVDNKHDLELRINYLKRRISYIKELLQMQRSLLEYSEDIK